MGAVATRSVGAREQGAAASGRETGVVLSIGRAWPLLRERSEPIAAGSEEAIGRRPWAMARGEIRWQASGDVAGGFPGFATRGGRLKGVRLRVTDRFLLVDEGRADGFGLPLDALEAADVANPPPIPGARCGPVLRLAYRDGQLVRTFVVRPSGGARRRGHGAALALAAIADAGVPNLGDRWGSLGVSWSAARHFGHENVVWGGRATAPLGVGLERAACELWLTTRSLIWVGGTADRVSRLPLGLVRDVIPFQVADRAGTPGVVVAFADEGGARHDLSFLFDRHRSADRNQRERGAFLVGLRSRGVPLGVAAPLRQPWRPDVRPVVPSAIRADRPAAKKDDAPAASADDSSVATPVVHHLPEPPSNDPGLPPEPGYAESAGAMGRQARPPEFPRVRAYEAAALAVLAATTRLISNPCGRDAVAPPPPARFDDALTELEVATMLGAIDPVVATARRDRLVALAEAAARLRALLELRAAGSVADADLEPRRAAILAPLAEQVFGS